ncbi:MAG TPA: hypothetical protein VJK71_11340, partial [Gemmatimonadales bacterium]|nr:hypothetical protein [Gemmatimonadales bacterium]
MRGPNEREAMSRSEMFNRLVARGENALSLQDKIQLATDLRAQSRETSRQLDTFFLEEADRLWTGVEQARARMDELQRVHERLTAPPWHTGVFLGVTPTERGMAAVVNLNGMPRVVNVADSVDVESLQPGAEVMLGPELNVVVGTLAQGFLATGDTAVFDRWLGDDRMIIRARDEEIVVRAASGLRDDAPEPGDLVRWSRSLGLAFERLPKSHGEHLFLEDTPGDCFADIGGLDAQ